MMIPKVKLKHDKNGTIIKINEIDWARDLGRNKYAGYSRVGENHAGNPDDVVNVVTEVPTANEAEIKVVQDAMAANAEEKLGDEEQKEEESADKTESTDETSTTTESESESDSKDDDNKDKDSKEDKDKKKPGRRAPTNKS